MSITKAIQRLAPHLLGWGALFLVIILQNDLNEWEFEDYYSIIGIFCFIALATYINLYLLIPRYLFLKKHKHYASFASLLVIATALLITFWLSELDQIDWFSRFIVSIINVVFVLLMTSAGRFLIEYLRKMMKLKEIENKQLKAELNLLKAQVNPHFLFNTLNNLYGLITQNQNQKAAEITLKLADLMRYLLESSKADKVSLNKEIQFLEDYLSLEKIRLSPKTDLKFTVSRIKKEIFITPLLFIPMVENAFKHGLNTISTDSFAHFSLSVQGDELFFEAINSVGKSPENSEKSGTGLENLKKRLQLIYPQKHQLYIEQTSNQFKVILHIQL
ncbi:MAG: sensor histidine kinase [Sphingobacteriaceae bacterium]